MFLHLGGDVVIPVQNIISIIDAESIAKSKDSKAFFQAVKAKKSIVKITQEKPKSYVLTQKEIKTGIGKRVKTVIYYSPISSTTLQKRANFIKNINSSY
jgi:hypothetical protein